VDAGQIVNTQKRKTSKRESGNQAAPPPRFSPSLFSTFRRGDFAVSQLNPSTFNL
jgi:hypothetical protein